MGVEPTQGSFEPHAGFEDQERHRAPVTSAASITALLNACYGDAPDLHAGREVRPPTVPADGVAVKQVVNHYRTFRIPRAESHEIGFQWFENRRTVLESFTQFAGMGRLVSDLRPDDFQQYRQRLAKQGLAGRGGLGVHALNRAVTIVRGMLKYAYDVDLLRFPVKFGKSFARPSADPLPVN